MLLKLRSTSSRMAAMSLISLATSLPLSVMNILVDLPSRICLISPSPSRAFNLSGMREFLTTS